MYARYLRAGQALGGFTSSYSPAPPPQLEYEDCDQCPLGISDMVSYWAEVQVFGGMVLFEQGDTDLDVSHPASINPYK